MAVGWRGNRVAAALVAALLVAGCGPNANRPSVLPSEDSSDQHGASPTPATSAMISAQPTVVTGPGRIVFAQFEGQVDVYGIYTINPDGSGLKLVLEGKHTGPHWSPDGRRIATTTSSINSPTFVTIVNADGSGAHDLVRPDPTLELRCTLWTPDGTRLVCEGFDRKKLGRIGLYSVRSSDGGGLQRITEGGAVADDVPGAFSPDGTKLIFIRTTYAVLQLGQLWICDADGANARKLTDTLFGYQVSWSPDARMIAADHDGSLLLFDMANLAAPALVLTLPQGRASSPRWSPDSHRLVFEMAKTKATTADIWVINADGFDLQQLTTGALDDISPDWGLSP